MSTQNTRRQKQVVFIFLWVCVLFICAVNAAQKIRYASNVECDRYSLDAVYNERFKVITENVFKDCEEFVNRVSDLISESLTTIMAELPDRDKSDNRDKKIFSQWRAVKKSFSSRMKKIHRKITSAWEDLLGNHFDLMYDNGKSSLDEYLNKTRKMSDAYNEARKSVDEGMEGFVGFVKGVVRDGIQGISGAADIAVKKEEEAKNKTEGNGSSDDDAESKNDNESREEKLQKKKEEIAEMVVQGFLGKVTMDALKKKMDLFKQVTIDPENRDSVLDDLLFDIIMIKNRMRAIIQDDIPNDKGSIDLARRSIYTYWADIAEQMYKEKIKSKQSTEPGGDAYYRKLWGDEKQLAATLLDLMEIYS